MKKKYTMEEFEEMYNDAVNKTLERLNLMLQEVIEVRKSKDNINPLAPAAFSMQNMMAFAELASTLFDKEDNE